MSDSHIQRDMPGGYAEKLRAARESRQMAGERRVITMLFCDVVESTAMAERLDPEEWAEIMDEAFDFLIAPVFRYEGTLARMMGDAILAFFGAPIAHEDDPQRAILAGLDIIEAIGPFRERIRDRYELDFNVRVGINTGPVVVGEIGSDLAVEYTAMGDAVNLAARMEATAEPGTVQIAQDTHKLVAPLFDFQPLGPIQVKGKREPIQGYRVLGLKDQPGRVRGIEGLKAPLIGRAEELAVLRQSLQSLDGRGKVIFIIGEAGLGKSRLLSEFRQEPGDTQDDAIIWRTSQSLPYEANRPYSAVLGPLGEIIGIEPEATARQMARKIAAATAHLPESERGLTAAALTALLLGHEAVRDKPVEAEAIKRVLFDFILDSCAVEPGQGKSVLIFDDLHWADPVSAELLARLCRLAEQGPVLILCAMRPYRKSAGWQAREEVMEKFADAYLELWLSPLSAGDSNLLLDNLLRIADLPASLRRLIFDKAEGNPLFVEEVVRSLIELGAVVQDSAGLSWQSGIPIQEIAIPDTLQGLLISRIDRLDKKSKRALQLASVIGRSFYLRVLEAISDDADDLSDRLATLQAADLIRLHSGRPDVEYVFRHELTRDATYQTILRKEKRIYHAQVAKALESMAAGRTEEEAHRLGYHFREAGQRDKALYYFTLAGEAAGRLFANSQAAEFYRQGQLIARDIGTGEQLIELYDKRGRSLELDGQYDEAMANYLELAGLGIERDEPELTLESLLDRALLKATYTSAFDPEEALELIQEALVMAGELNRHKAIAKAYWIRSMVSGAKGEMESFLEDTERSLAIARQYNLREQEAYTLHDMATPLLLTGRPQEALDAIKQAGGLFRELDNRPMLVDNRATYSYAVSLFDHLDRGQKVGQEALALSREIGSLWGEAYSHMNLGPIFFRKGQLGTAVQNMSRALELAGESGLTAPRVYIRFHLLLSQLTIGDLDGAEVELRLLEEEAERFKSDRIALLCLYQAPIYYNMERGRLKEARSGLETLSQLAGEMDTRLFDLLPSSLTAQPDCRLSLLEGDLQGAIACAGRHIGHLEYIGVHRFLTDYYAIKGQAYLRLGQFLPCRTALLRALELSLRSGERILRWKVRTLLADLASATGEMEEGTKERQLALDEVQYIVDHIGSEQSRRAFLNRAEIREVN